MQFSTLLCPTIIQTRLVLAVVLYSAIASLRLYAAIFVPIIDPLGTSDYYQAQDISGDGAVIVGDARGNGPRAFRLKLGEAFEYLGDLSGNPNGQGYAHGASFDGSKIVGRSNGPNGVETFIWEEGQGMSILPGLDGNDTIPTRISDDGTTIVGQTKPNGRVTKAFVLNDKDGVIHIESINRDSGPGNFRSSATAVSADGSIVAGSMWVGSESAIGGFVWTEDSGLTAIGDLPKIASNTADEYGSEIHALSSDGTTAVGQSSREHPIREAVYWTKDEGLVSLDVLNSLQSDYSLASAVSSDGSVIAGHYGITGTPGSATFLWTESTGAQDLSLILQQSGADLQGWQLTEIVTMSNDGNTIVGYGQDSAGEFGSWYAQLSIAIPEPSTLTCFLALVVLYITVNPSRDSRESYDFDSYL